MGRERAAAGTQGAAGANELLRFDSVTDLVRTVKDRAPGADVWTENRDDGFLLCVRGDHVEYESLIVHFEGEGCYAVEVY